MRIPLIGIMLLAICTQPITAQQGKRARRSEQGENYYNLGTRHALSGQYEQAIKDFTQAINLNSADADAYFSLGNAYSGLGRWAEAIGAYQRAVRLKPIDGEAYNNLGIAYFKSGSLKEAVAAFKQATRIYPAWAEPHFNLSTVYSKLERPNEAAESYQKAIHLKPGYSSRALLAAAQPPATAAIPQRSSNNKTLPEQIAVNNEASKRDVVVKTETAKRVAAAKSNYAKTFYNLGVKYGRAGRYRDSAEAFSQAVNMRPDYINAYFGLGHAYSDLGRWKEAISAYEKIIQLDPKDDEAYTMLGQVYAKLRAQAATNDASGNDLASAVTAEATRNVASPTASVSAPANETKTEAPASGGAPPVEKSVAPATDDVAPKTAAVSATPDATSPKEEEAAKPEPPPTVINSKDPTSIYLVGSGDVLDIHRLNAETRQSTLFTVTDGGMLEYPLISEPLQVAGLPVNEIGARLESELKRRGVDQQPKVAVGVREYSSHNIIVSGLVNEPGTKVLRREAIPLYVVIADAQPRPEAGQALIISHEGGQRTTVDLTDSQAKGKLIFPGDVITLEAKSQQFFYIGGSVRAPGQKQFHPGITLTQAVLGAGRKLSDGGDVKIMRQSENGLLITTTYDLKSIVSGKTPDASVQPDDRIEVAP